MSTARTYNDRANALAASIGDDRSRANVYHQSSWIAYVQGDARRALTHAEAAQAIASEQQLWALLARIASVRYNIHVNYDGDAEKAIAALEDMREAARRAGDRYLETQALGGLLDVAADRGRRDEAATIEQQLGRIGIDEMLPSTAVPPARALVRAWDGDFAGAYELVCHTAAEQPTVLRRSLRASEIALYAAAVVARRVRRPRIAGG
jgi:tetratricopeptide (TPR) repeat protein